MKNSIDTKLINEMIDASIQEHILSLDEGILDSVLDASYLGSLADKVLPKSLRRFLKSKLLIYLSKTLNFNINDGFGLAIKVLIENLDFETFGKFIDGEYECDDVVDIITKATASWVTQVGVRDLLAYLIRNYDVTDVFNDVINTYGFIPNSENMIASLNPFLGSDQQTKISKNQANAVVNSMMGVVSTQVLNSAVIYILEEYFIEDMSNKICQFFTEEYSDGIDQDNLKDIGGSDALKFVKDTIGAIS